MDDGFELLFAGSSKDVYLSGTGGLMKIVFSKRVSIFDRGPLPRQFPGLDNLRCSITVRCFEYLMANGVATHYVRRLDKNSILVKPVAIPEKPIIDKLIDSERRLLPTEILWRIKATTKFVERANRGITMDYSRFRLAPGEVLKPGSVFEPIFVECSTKHEQPDRYMKDAEVLLLANLSEKRLEELYDFTRKIALLLKNLFGSKYDLLTGKFEIAIDKHGSFMLVDSISPDELEIGGGFDKNPVRTEYKEQYPEWFAQLEEAKIKYPNEKSCWPDYPASPSDAVVSQMLGSYTAFAKDIGAI